MAAFFAELLPRYETCFNVFVFVHVCIDDIAEIRFAASLYALEDLIVFVVDRDDCLEFTFDGELCQLAFVKLPVERNYDSDTADYSQVGFAPLR